MVKTTDSSVGGVVDVTKIESLPLNGRQFANLAVTIPGVGLGFHSDPTKSTQYSPQIAGGNGRNVNYQIDGGDNNDDTVGGLLQLYPLEAIQEFNFITQRYKAEYGRSNGGVMNIVTKSGTNDLHGSWFTSFRDDSMNAKTETEKLSNIAKQDYRRYQYGGSFGGPIVQNKAHFFAAVERTQQDTKQAVTTFGLYPSQEGVFPTPSRENLFTGKVSANLSPSQYLSVRYGRNTNSQVYNAENRRVENNWGDSTNTFNSINLNHNWVLGGREAERVHLPVRGLRERDPRAHGRSAADVPERADGRLQRQHAAADAAAQVPVPRRLHVARDGQGRTRPRPEGRAQLHPRAAPVRHLLVGQHRLRLHAPDQRHQRSDQPRHAEQAGCVGEPADGPVRHVHPGRLPRDRSPDGQCRSSLRPVDRIPDRSVEDSELRRADGAAAAAGRFDGVPGFDEFGKKAQEDKNNIQPRLGAVWDVRGNGKDVVRAGWGIYYDYGFTNANILFPGLSAQGGSGVVFDAQQHGGHQEPGRQLLHRRPADLEHRRARTR